MDTETSNKKKAPDYFSSQPQFGYTNLAVNKMAIHGSFIYFFLHNGNWQPYPWRDLQKQLFWGENKQFRNHFL